MLRSSFVVSKKIEVAKVAEQKRFGFTKSERVCSKIECAALFTGGRSLFCYPYKALYLTRDGAKDGECKDSGTAHEGDSQASKENVKGARVLISVPKRYHRRANKRNTLKRRTREAFRLNKELFYNIAKEAGCANLSVDISFIYISKKEESYETIEKAVKKLLTEVATIATNGGKDGGDMAN